MSKGKWWCAAAAGLVAGAVTPVVWRAPEPALSLPRDVRTLDEALDDCLGTRLDGWELVEYATALVNQKFTRYSLWHLWETSGLAFKNSRGFSDQYNLALGRLLAGLGYQVQAVHAARVRFADEVVRAPWWNAGHTWLRVSHAGRTLDVCAARAEHRVGEISFDAISDVRPLNPWTGLNIRLALAVPVTYQVWKSWLTGRPVPAWLYRGFHDGGQLGV